MDGQRELYPLRKCKGGIKMKRNECSQCIIEKDGTLYCAINKKHNKFTPIGGKGESKEIPLDILKRELKEEVGELNIEKIEYLGKHIHVHNDKSEVDVHLYKVKVNSENELKSKEDFLEIIPIHFVLEKITTMNTYTSLCAIVEILKLKESV